MPSTVTLKHYANTKTTADTSITMPIAADSGHRIIGIHKSISANWDSASLHSLELVISAESGLIGCEILAICLTTVVNRLDK